MHSAKEDGQCPAPIPNFLAVFSHATRTFVHVGELANVACGVSVDFGLAGSDAALVRSGRSCRALSSFRFGVAARGLSAPPEMDLSCLPIVPPVEPACPKASDPPARNRMMARSGLVAAPLIRLPQFQRVIAYTGRRSSE